MSKIFDAFTTKKGKKEFQNLSNEKKAEVIQAALNQKISEVMTKEISKNILTGMELEAENIYNKYVKSIDEVEVGTEEFFNRIELMLSYFRKRHLEFKIKMDKLEEKDKEGE